MTTLKEIAAEFRQPSGRDHEDEELDRMARLVEAAQRLREAASGCHIFRVESCRTCVALADIDAIEGEE